MIRNLLFHLFAVMTFGIALVIPGMVAGGAPQSSIISITLPKLSAESKALCAKLIRFGKEAYMRGKYQDAKEYFRQAIMVDPTSKVSWKNYDLAVLYALAEKVENNTGLIAPGLSSAETRNLTPAATPLQALQSQALAPVFTTEVEGDEEEEKEEEGC